MARQRLLLNNKDSRSEDTKRLPAVEVGNREAELTLTGAPQSRQTSILRMQQTHGNQYVLRHIAKGASGGARAGNVRGAVQRDEDEDGGGDGGGGISEMLGGAADAVSSFGGSVADSVGGMASDVGNYMGGAAEGVSDTVGQLIDQGGAALGGGIPGMGDMGMEAGGIADNATNAMGSQDESLWDKFLGGFGGVLQKLFGPSQEDLDRRYREAGARNPKGLPPDIKIIYQQGDMIVAQGPAGREVWLYDQASESWHRKSK